MTIEPSSLEERKDLKRRGELQTTLQEAIRRSAPQSEIRRIQEQIEELNRKLESYSHRIKRPATP